MLPYHPISSHPNRPSILHGRFILKCVLTSIISLLQRAKKCIQNKQTDKKRMKENKQDKIFFFIMSSTSHYLTNFPFTMISPRRNSARSFIRMQVGECWWKLVFLLSLPVCLWIWHFPFFFVCNKRTIIATAIAKCCLWRLAGGGMAHWLTGWLTGWHSFHSFIVSVERRNVGHVFPFKCSFPQQKQKSRKQNMGMSRISYRRHQAGIILA